MHKEKHKATDLPLLEFKQGVNLSVMPPLMSREHFAMIVGTSIDTVRGWSQTGTIPTVKIGRQRLVNVAQLIKDLEQGKLRFSQGDYGDNKNT